MYVSRLQVEGIRGFHGNRNADLSFAGEVGDRAGWTVLAGRNGSGKSTVLRALALAIGLPQSVDSDLSTWPSSSDDGGRIRVLLEAEDNEVSWLLDERPSAVRERFLAGNCVVESVCEWHPRRKTPRWERTILSVSGPAAGERTSVEDDFWEVSLSDGFVHAGYGPFRRLSQDWRAASGRHESRFSTLLSEDSVLSEGVAWLMQQHLRSLEQKAGAEELLQAAIALLGDGLLPDEYRVQHIDSDGLWVERDGRQIPLAALSDGIRTTVAMVTHLLGELDSTRGAGLGLQTKSASGSPVVTSPAVVLIDEIDAHLHVSWQQRIGGWMTSHFPRVQFIVTTHSPYICQAAGDGGLIRLPGPNEDTPPHVVSDDLYRRVVYGSGDDGALSELFGLESPYSGPAEKLRRRLGDLEERVLAGDATRAEQEEYAALSRMLASSLAARVDEVAARIARHGE